MARASHIQLPATNENMGQLLAWKEDIGGDADSFAARATESSVCRSASKGGDLGFLTRGKLYAGPRTEPGSLSLCPSPCPYSVQARSHPLTSLTRISIHGSHSSKEFDDVIFVEEPGGVYGPIRTQFGLHLICVHSCREPEAPSALQAIQQQYFGGGETSEDAPPRQ